MQVLSLRTLVLPLLLTLAAVQTKPAAAQTVPAGRADAARSYAAFEAAWREHPPQGQLRRTLAGQFDRMARFWFRRDFNAAVRSFDAGTNALLPTQETTPAAQAARASRLVVTPPFAIVGEDATVSLRIDPLYDVNAAPETLSVEIDGTDKMLRLAREGGRATVEIDRLEPGRYPVRVEGVERGVLFVLADAPSAVRGQLRARLDRLRPGVAPEDVPAFTAVERRLDLLRDQPDAESVTSLLADPLELSQQLAEEVAALEAGVDPFAGRPGGYWRTFSPQAGPPLDIPARVYAPAAVASSDAPVPLVIALHGAGGDENLFMEGYGAGEVRRLADQYGFLLVSPQTYPTMFDGRSLDTILAGLSRSYDVDADRVYVVGHSLGAITAAAWARRNPGRIAGIGLIAGGGLATGPQIAVPTFVAAAEYDYIFGVGELSTLSDLAAAAGADSAFRIYPETGHVSIVPEALPDAIKWLLRRESKSPVDEQD